jgi:hypothetical protein
MRCVAVARTIMRCVTAVGLRFAAAAAPRRWSTSIYRHLLVLDLAHPVKHLVKHFTGGTELRPDFTKRYAELSGGSVAASVHGRAHRRSRQWSAADRRANGG